jgi:hypothetical protein
MMNPLKSQRSLRAVREKSFLQVSHPIIKRMNARLNRHSFFGLLLLFYELEPESVPVPGCTTFMGSDFFSITTHKGKIFIPVCK